MQRIAHEIQFRFRIICNGIIIRTDIWVFTNDIGNKWMIFSGKGASLGQVMTLPPANDNGSIYLRHTGNHYEPIVGVSHFKLV